MMRGGKYDGHGLACWRFIRDRRAGMGMRFWGPDTIGIDVYFLFFLWI